MPSHMMSVLSCDAVVDLIAVCDVALNKASKPQIFRLIFYAKLTDVRR